MFIQIMEDKGLISLINFFSRRIANKYYKTYSYDDAKQELLLHTFEVYQKKRQELQDSMVQYLKGAVRNRAFDLLSIKRSYGKRVTNHQAVMTYEDDTQASCVNILKSYTDSAGLQTFLTRDDVDRAYSVVIQKFQICDTVTHHRAADILRMLTYGYKQSEIAKKMKVSPNLVTKIARNVIIPELRRELCYG